MLCSLCLSFAQIILNDAPPVAITNTRPHPRETHTLTTAPPKIAEDIDRQSPRSFNHYLHYRQLEHSASTGCELCSLIVNSTSSESRQAGHSQLKAELQGEKPVRFWSIRTSKTVDRGAKLQFRVNLGTDAGIDKFSLHLEFYKRCGMCSVLDFSLK